MKSNMLKVRQDLMDVNAPESTVNKGPHHKETPLQKQKNNPSNKKRKRKKNKSKTTNATEEFMRLGVPQQQQKKNVVRVLPYWLQHPRPVGQDLQKDSCPLSQLPYLKEKLVHALEEEGFKKLFPVQRAVIPEIIFQANKYYSGGRASDLCVSAATGSGKTLAYVLPVLQVVSAMTTLPRIRVLVILPTEQLATQITRVFKRYGSSVGVKVGSAVGSTNFQQEQKELVAPLEDWERDLVAGGARGITGEGGANITHKCLVHVVVATPDRLKDHMMHTPAFDLRHLRYLIFDEADRLVSGDGGQWMNSIVKRIQHLQADNDKGNVFGGLIMPGFTAPRSHFAHKLLISATLSCDAEKLNALNLYDPILFTTPASDPGAAHTGQAMAGENAPTDARTALGFVRPATLKEKFVIVEQEVQPLLLHHFIVGNSWKKVLVFTNTQESSHRLALVLKALSNDEYKVGEFSSKLGRLQRVMADDFSKGIIDVLVCTDSLSRGVDFENVEVVVNYDTTQCSQTYVHRVGRTARAGKQGLALSMLLPSMPRYKFKAMLTESGSGLVEQLRYDKAVLFPLEQLYKDALEAVRLQLSAPDRNNPRGAQIRVVGGREKRQRKLSQTNQINKRHQKQ